MKKYYFASLSLVLIVGLIFLLFPPGRSYASFSYYRSITIDHTKVPNTDQTNFPVLISGTYNGSGGIADLRTVGNGGKVQNSSGYDVGFYTNSDCSTGKLNWETQTYTASTGVVNYWVNISSLSHSTDNVFYMCYGDSSISTDQSNKAATWNSNYKGVWHLNDNAANTTVVDATGTSNGTNNANTSTKTVSGTFGSSALNYNGSTDYTDLGGAPYSLTNNFTAQVWVYPTNSSTDFGVFATVGAMSKINSSSGNGYGIITSNQTWRFYGVGGYLNSGKSDVNSWHSIVVTVNSGTRTFYYDGASVGGTDSASIGTSASNLVLGSFYANLPSGSGYNYVGYIQEARVSDTPRSADWVATEYNNQSCPDKSGGAGCFYTVGSETANTPAAVGPFHKFVFQANHKIIFDSNKKYILK